MSAGGAITTTGARPVVPPINTTNLPPPAPPIPSSLTANRGGGGGALGNKPVPPPPAKSPLRASSRATTREQHQQERAALGRTRSGSAGSTSSSISRRRGDGKVIQLTMPTPLSALDPPTPTRAEQIPSPTSQGLGQAQLASMLEKTRRARETTTAGAGVGAGNLYPPPASPLNIKKKAPQRPGTGNSSNGNNTIRRESSFTKLNKRLTRKPSMAFTGLNLQRMGMGRKRSSNGSGGGGYKRSGISSEDVFRNLDRSQEGGRGQGRGQGEEEAGNDDNVPLQTLQQRQSVGLTRRLSKKKQMQPSTQTQKQRPGQGEWTRRRSSLAKLARRESVKLKSILKNPIRSQPQQPQLPTQNQKQAEPMPQSPPKPQVASTGPAEPIARSTGVDTNSSLGVAQPRTKTVNSVTWDSSPPREGAAPSSAAATSTGPGRRRSGTGTKLRSILKPSPSVNPELVAPVPTKPSTLASAAMTLEDDKENVQPTQMQMPVPMQANNNQAIADQPQQTPVENARTRLQRTRTQSTAQLPLIAKKESTPTPTPPLPQITTTTTTTAKEMRNRTSTASGASSSTTGKDILNEIDLKQLSASEARKLIRQHNRQYFQSQIWDPALAKDFVETYQVANAGERDDQQFYQRQPPPQNLGLGAIANGINSNNTNWNGNGNGNGKRNSYSQMLIQGTPRNSWKRTSFFRPSPPPKDDDLEKFDWKKFGSPFTSNTNAGEKRTSRDRDSRDDWGLSVRLALAKLENKITTEASNDPVKFMKARRESAQLRAWIASQRRTSESRLSKIASARQQLMSLGVTIGSGGGGAVGSVGVGGAGVGVGAAPAGRVSAATNATGSTGDGATNTLEQDDDAFVAELLRENEIKLKHSSNPMGEAERMFGTPNANHHYTPFSQHPAGLATLQEEAEGESREGDDSEKEKHLIPGDSSIGAHPQVRDRQTVSTSAFFRPGPLRSRAKSSVFSIFDERKAARREGRKYKSKSKFLSTATNTTSATGTSTTTQSQIDQVEMQEARCCGLWKPKAFVDEISQDSDMVRKNNIG